MKVVAHCKFSKGSMDEWVSFYNSQASSLIDFVSQEVLGIAGQRDGLLLGHWQSRSTAGAWFRP